MAYIESLLTSISLSLMNIGPTLSLILILLAGIMYALAQAQPPEQRGKWVTWATNLLIGGIVLAVIVGGATVIRDISSQALT
ncbi:MAG: hypothetical protein PHU63_01685 [Candidatus ainarchaeum sp.]|nr:hypothetical protein [Candidatus ainarchaeum sp.]